MTRENKFKIGLCLQEIALSLDEVTFKANEERLKVIEDIIAGEQEPCEDVISRQAVMDCFKKWQPYMATRLWYFEQELSKLPSVNSQETKMGHWIFKNGRYRCDVCGEKAIYHYSGSSSITQTEILTRYCPSCGVKMSDTNTDRRDKE